MREDNRWVKLLRMIPWDNVEDLYAQRMIANNSAKTMSARIAYGAIYIKEHKNLTDEQIVVYIAENPYMQYFLGRHVFDDMPLFDASMMMHFHKRFPADKIEAINKRMFFLEPPERSDDDPPPLNSVKLVLDATCASADI